MSQLLDSANLTAFASVATIWEIVIKHRLGKISLPMNPAGISSALADLGIAMLKIEESHVLAEVIPEPGTRNPFDRLLLSICAAENLRLITLDRALTGHPLAWKESGA